jgi:hypothetical protein
MRNPPFHRLKTTEQRQPPTAAMLFQHSTEGTIKAKAFVYTAGITASNIALNCCFYFVSIFSFNNVIDLLKPNGYYMYHLL